VQLTTIKDWKLLPYGAWQTPDSFVIHDRKYRPLIRLAAHEDQDEPCEGWGNADLPGGIDCHASGGDPCFIRVRPETAHVVDPSEWIEHDKDWAYWFYKGEPDRARLQQLVDSIPELGAEIERRDAAAVAAKKAEREAFEIPRPNIRDFFKGRTYALPTIEESLATPLSNDLIFGWALYAEKTPPTVNVENLAWDLRRRCGPKQGFEYYTWLVNEWGHWETIDTQWATADRPECEGDQHIIYELVSIHHRGRLLELMPQGDLLEQMQPDEVESVRKELDALADRFDTLQFEATKEAFEPYRTYKGRGFDPLREQFKRCEQAQFARDMSAGRIPGPSAPEDPTPSYFKPRLGPTLLGRKRK
jgi:hypothetical protein